ncbi:U2 small nuclear ribonucleoprotein auxiliary factor 35 kDa subunit-related protein 2 isoform X1 [Scleropages formosus]|uniref:U2 small nuclear ribonucleoprotein auxiliary factor 35 kDa subunit-related protein 2 isoform X1 n=1 Tax=Scleropages formosus TaxID=113540 RepID=UPI0010FA6E2A|nr:U2 small nuclear ribonucleoprotein auxiliary factor 35 kDa subunit-related protein 2 isoform X1 [Scleropages formosus]
MAAPAEPGSGRKQRRAALQKQRRKKRRQALARLRDAELQEENGEEHQSQEECEEEEERKAEEERQRLHLEWLERERVAQEEFQVKKEREEAARRKKEEEEKRIKEEWEARQRKEQEEREQKQQEKREREEAVQRMLDQAESQLENGEPWKNPEAPVDYGTEKDKANCPFFLKTGACRFGERCSRKHVHPTCSTTLMIRGMFITFGMEQSRRDDYDTDASLEYSEEEIYQQFLDFYEDVLPEFRTAGKVVQFKVSCNFEPHLRGNVYVQYDTKEQCKEALLMFNGRWYAGRQLQCEFSPVTRWKTAICGLFDRRKCPKGKHCNFLHVYRNPGNEFWEADRDLNTSPDRGGTFMGWNSERYSERRDRSRRFCTYSPDKSQRRHGERRSRSRERRVRRSRSHSRERRERKEERSWICSHKRKQRSSRSRSRERRERKEERSRGHSRERRNRSHSRERRERKEERRSRSLSREKKDRKEEKRSRSKDRNPSSRDRLNKWSRSGEMKRDGSRNGEMSEGSKESANTKDSLRKRSKRSESRSSKEPDTSKPNGNSSPRHHKHSKKSKKKKSKKKKKKRSKSVSESSADSGKESGNDLKKHEEETVDIQDAENTGSPQENKLAQTTSPHVCQENISPLSSHQDIPHEVDCQLVTADRTVSDRPSWCQR